MRALLFFLSVGFLLLLALHVQQSFLPFVQQWWFCPADDCNAVYFSKLIGSSSGACAFFDLSDAQLLDFFKNASFSLVLDHRSSVLLPFAFVMNQSNLMHHKFCFFPPATVLTGSFNPTAGNNNANLLVAIHDPLVFAAYRAAFSQLQGKSHAVQFSSFACFAPWQDCRSFLFFHLQQAKREIIGLLFSFTDKALATLLLQKQYEGVSVMLFLEKTLAYHQGSIVPYWQANNGTIFFDNCPCFFHLKAFVIDRRFVLFGSLNPGRQGYRNYENVLIVDSPQLAEELLHFAASYFSANASSFLFSNEKSKRMP